MSSLLTEALSLCNLAAVGIFGIVLSAAFCEIEWTRCHKLLLVGCTILMLALQGVVSLRWGTGLARYLYPLITHLPLWLLLAAMTRILKNLFLLLYGSFSVQKKMTKESFRKLYLLQRKEK